MKDVYKNYSKGPLFGKNIYIPYLIYYNSPGISARNGKQHEFKYHFSFYYTNDFKAGDIVKDAKSDEIVKVDLIRDYESLIVELGADYFITKNLQIGVDTRLISYYGGFLDPVVQGFHYAFQLPNAGRQYVDQNGVYINILNHNNVSLHLDSPAVSFGDIDTWIKYNFFERKWISLALMGSLKIPTGNIYYISGSGFPDFSFNILSDFRPVWILSFYLQAGFVLPFDTLLWSYYSNPYPMFNGLAGIELNPLSFFSLIAQFNIKSPSMRYSYPHSNPYLSNFDYLSLPQINLLAGFIFKYKDFTWQFYFEEDTFTNSGTDFTINLMFSHKLKLNNFR